MSQDASRPSTAGRPAAPQPVSRQTRMARLLLPLYVALYGGFVGMVAFAPQRMMEPSPVESVNVALLYGMGLVLAALVLALLSMLLSRPRRSPPTGTRLPLLRH